MRVTNSMMVNTLNRNLSNSMRVMDKTQNQLSTGKRISKGSDDPVGVAYAMRMRTNIVETEQYQKNVSDALSWLEATDSALGDIGNALQRVRELAVNAANGTHNAESLKAINDEIGQIKDHIQNTANTNLAGRYLFSGTSTGIQSYVNGVMQGNQNKVHYEIGVGTRLPINVTAGEVFSDLDAAGNETDSIFMALDKLMLDINSGDSALISSNLSAIDKWMDKNLSTRAEVGARINRLELTDNRLNETELNFTKLLSETEDADMAEVLTKLKMQESVYRAALGAGARIVQPTLIDFLR